MLDRFTPFLGTYHTTSPGDGVCPTGLRVQFIETFSLQRIDDWVQYDQRAVRVEDARVLHTESGVFRRGDDGALQLSLVMNSGRLELGTATWRGTHLRTESSTFINDRLGVRANERRFAFDDAGCAKELWLATPVWPELTRHMWGRLLRRS